VTGCSGILARFLVVIRSAWTFFYLDKRRSLGPRHFFDSLKIPIKMHSIFMLSASLWFGLKKGRSARHGGFFRRPNFTLS
jgi:hypothetical protein